MDTARIKQKKPLTPKEKEKLIKAVKKTVMQYKVTLKLLAKT